MPATRRRGHDGEKQQHQQQQQQRQQRQQQQQQQQSADDDEAAKSVMGRVVAGVVVIAFVVGVATSGLVSGSNPTTAETEPSTPELTSTAVLESPLSYTVPCVPPEPEDGVPVGAPGCNPTWCGRVVQDNFIDPHAVDVLRSVAEVGMVGSVTTEAGGPVILDLSSGFTLDAGGLRNVLKEPDGPLPFTDEHFAVYHDAIRRVKDAVQAHFGLDHIYFTAPSFITRIHGKSSWEPATVHDEYYHLHVDQKNTPHYDYSALLYLAEHGVDFTGGEFHFQDALPDGQHHNHTVLPRPGRLSFFTAGRENWHRVRKVESGYRLVLAMWFTCDKSKAVDLQAMLQRAHARVNA